MSEKENHTSDSYSGEVFADNEAAIDESEIYTDAAADVAEAAFVSGEAAQQKEEEDITAQGYSEEKARRLKATGYEKSQRRLEALRNPDAVEFKDRLSAAWAYPIGRIEPLSEEKMTVLVENIYTVSDACGLIHRPKNWKKMSADDQRAFTAAVKNQMYHNLQQYNRKNSRGAAMLARAYRSYGRTVPPSEKKLASLTKIVSTVNAGHENDNNVSDDVCRNLKSVLEEYRQKHPSEKENEQKKTPSDTESQNNEPEDEELDGMPDNADAPLHEDYADDEPEGLEPEFPNAHEELKQDAEKEQQKGEKPAEATEGAEKKAESEDEKQAEKLAEGAAVATAAAAAAAAVPEAIVDVQPVVEKKTITADVSDDNSGELLSHETVVQEKPAGEKLTVLNKDEMDASEFYASKQGIEAAGKMKAIDRFGKEFAKVDEKPDQPAGETYQSLVAMLKPGGDWGYINKDDTSHIIAIQNNTPGGYPFTLQFSSANGTLANAIEKAKTQVLFTAVSNWKKSREQSQQAQTQTQRKTIKSKSTLTMHD